VYFTASALNGVPSWKVTPWRSVKRRRLASTNSQEVASRPSISMSWLTVMSGSRICV